MNDFLHLLDHLSAVVFADHYSGFWILEYVIELVQLVRLLMKHSGEHDKHNTARSNEEEAQNSGSFVHHLCDILLQRLFFFLVGVLFSLTCFVQIFLRAIINISDRLCLNFLAKLFGIKFVLIVKLLVNCQIINRFLI